jgi:phenylalanyl-tRNA synthetase beta chain
VGIRPINNVADVTNFVLMELGHPLHAFDLNKIDGCRIIVREAVVAEKLVTLDGEDRALSAGTLVIADQSRPVALAGIMGGLESEISDTTSTVLLESAWFDPVSIRKTAKQLGMHTEASHRFERGADISATVAALDRTARLIQQLAGGEILLGVVDVYPQPVRREPIFLRKSRISQIMGTDLKPDKVVDLLNRLELRVLQGTPEGWEVALPTFRLDVEREIDLIEEVARHFGYGNFPSTLPSWKGEVHRRQEYLRDIPIKEKLLHLGYSETFTYSFVSAEETRRFSQSEPVPLLNPLSSEMGVLRTSLLPGLLDSLLRNYNRGMKTVRLYEAGKVFHGCCHQPEETVMLGLILTGNAQDRTVHCSQRAFRFFDLKGDLEALLTSLSVLANATEFTCPEESERPDYYQPGVVAKICCQGRELGILGQLHPDVCDAYKIRQPVFVAELLLASWYSLEVPERGFSEIPKFPAIQRDLSVVVDQTIDYGRIEATIKRIGIREIQKTYPFDVYKGEDMPPGKKAVAFTLLFQSLERTLVEEEVNRLLECILEHLKTELGAQLRS